MDVWAAVALGLVGVAAGLAVGLALRRAAVAAVAVGVRQEAERELLPLREQLRGREELLSEGRRHAAEAAGALEAGRSRVVALSVEVARLQAELAAERRAAAERSEEAARNQEQVRAEVEKLAGRVLSDQGRDLLARSQEGLAALLGPLGEKLREFEGRVEQTYLQENRDRASLLASLDHLRETQQKLHQDAEALSRALTGDSKAQGDWGEVVLERLLETAGLTEGREYDLQSSHVDEAGGRKRPDAVVFMPGGRAVVVDAKCSLTAFVGAARAATPELREAALDAHLESVRAHVRGLAGKSYQDVLEERTLDIVLLFIPNEAAFHAAIARAPGLYEEAFRQRVVLCSPTTLLAALQLIAHVWRSEKQNANARQIAEQAGLMLEKLAAFVRDLDEVGGRLGQAQTAYAAARHKLLSGRGNLIGKAQAVARLGARVKSEKVEQLLLLGAEPDGGEAPEPGEGAEDGPVLPAGEGSGLSRR